MAYHWTGNMAQGGRLVKKHRPAEVKRKVVDTKATPKPRIERTQRDSIFTPEQWAERLAPGWDERGWHGGGMCKVRNMVQKTRASKGNSRTGRFAHPSLLHLTK